MTDKTTASDGWVEAVKRADSDTLSVILRQEREKLDQYEGYALFYQSRVNAIVTELDGRGITNV